MTAQEKLIRTAFNEIGYLEKRSNAELDDKTANAGTANYTKYARDLDELAFYNGKKNGYAWCEAFVDWCFVQTFGMENALKMTNQPKGGLGASATWSKRYYEEAGRFFKEPEIGDQIFFTNDDGESMYHTGIVSNIDDAYVYTIEGNTSAAAGVDPNGGAVEAKHYALNHRKIGGYGRPDYSIVEPAPEAVDEDYEKFKAYMARYEAERAELPPAEWSAQSRQWAENEGIIQGIGGGVMAYQMPLTREQYVEMEYRQRNK